MSNILELHKQFFFVRKSTLLYFLLIAGLIISYYIIFYNFETGFWYNKPYLDDNYYKFHPEDGDTCPVLQEKLNYWHPDGTNPIRIQILVAMFETRCEGIILNTFTGNK